MMKMTVIPYYENMQRVYVNQKDYIFKEGDINDKKVYFIQEGDVIL